ncbi:MAG: hypothetical protein F6K41_00230 [Symploca sp. SIO3E6]|nr:hypothetical protein [Caldora sp. SIO3E6]
MLIIVPSLFNQDLSKSSLLPNPAEITLWMPNALKAVLQAEAEGSEAPRKEAPREESLVR